MNPSPSSRLATRLLGPACIGLCAGVGLPAAHAASHAASHATKAPAAIAATVAPPAPVVAQADPLPSYAMKGGRMICGDRLRMDVRIEGKDDHAIDLTWKGRHYLLLRKPTTTGAYQRIQGLPIDEFSRSCMDKTLGELLEERDGVKHLL